MKTPREILLQQHQATTPKLDAIRDEVVAGLSLAPAPETMSWREWLHSLRWHLAAMSAAWVVVIILNVDHSTGPSANLALGKAPPPQQIWASMRENRRLFLQYSLEFGDAPAAENPVVPGRRSEIQPQQVMV